jgi:hypothetical protein
MKVFISHQKADTEIALHISQRLKYIHSIDSYVDVIDTSIGNGEDLALHIQVQMDKCTQLIAVVSEATKTSWWVPWEIGVASEKDFPLATYSSGQLLPPEYLRKWPYLRSDEDIDSYARASKSANKSFNQRRSSLNEQVARIRSTREFYSTIRKSLNQ